MGKKTIAAACLCLCLGIAGITAPHASVDGKDVSQGQEITQLAVQKKAADIKTVKATKKKTVKKLGKIYKLAKNYNQVYKVLKKGGTDVMVSVDYAMAEDTADGAAAVPNGAAESRNESVTAESASKDASATESAAEDGSYSTTNLQVEGVDESDIIKTDGKFLYVANEQEVTILNLQKGVPEVVANLVPEGLSDEGWIQELYVADGKMAIVAVDNETELTETGNTTKTQETADGNIVETDKNLVIARPYVAYIHTQLKTKIITYDISKPKKPAYLDTTYQDGDYETSRKVGDKLYLFTRNYLSADEQTIGGDDGEIWLPTVNGKKIAANRIYIPKRGNESLLMSCIQLDKAHKVLDTKLLINDRAEFYITSKSIYIYNTVYNYSSGSVAEKTQIARFALTDDGLIQAVSAKTVPGNVEDTFAIQEQDGYLRVLTSITSASPWENRVYVLDSNLKIVGKITKLAQGERIYAARFFGNIGYFVTYRNTDPLFTVDFSNPKEPKIIGELKITGFSDYLHFWGNNKLLGIGYETDEETGMRLGIKLTMFDISNPAKVQAESSLVIKDADSTPATDYYKTVLIDQKKNVIAFTTEYYGDYYNYDYKVNYRVFSYENGKFQSHLNHELDKNESMYDLRSLYANNVLYLAGRGKAIAFDMKKQYKKLGETEY